MKCYYHPDREAVTRCVKCGKPLCEKCVRKLRKRFLYILWKDYDYCPACYEKEMQKLIKEWREKRKRT
ncbi:hypothetical protein DRN74_04215 [Candidatus Micrarchaeota archaeon]|nr:MAG: hypothetical protein DRN74_04215 [Candidatus Micrarchaeota archaeon]